jgi:HlyD family secretion protein
MRLKSTRRQDNNKDAGKLSFVKRFPRILIFVVIAGGIGVLVFLLAISGKSDGSNPGTGTFAVVRRGDLTISVTEAGDIKSLESVDLACGVEGRTTIISIVDEGTYITPEDVNNGKILVELDSSEIKQNLTQQEITFLSAEASYTEAKEALDIQKKQNDSNIKAGELKVRFALMDLQKYLGDVVAGKIMSGTANPGVEPNEIVLLIEDPNLGGGALQRLRELEGDIYLKMQNLELAKSKYEWTEKLYEKRYVSLSDKEADRLDKEQTGIKWEQAKTAKDLFVRYEFPKEAEKLLSDYYEAERELERIEARARSELAQAEAKLKSNEATYSLQKERLEKWHKQFDACVMRAPVPGQVVYSSSMMDRWERRNRKIEVGAEVRERQKIISIPDPSVMKVEIKIHETWVDKIQPGQEAKITISAFPEGTFTGKVIKKAPLADPEEWTNPDLKVYSTDVRIDGTHNFLKTGMTAKVEIIIEELKDVLSVPIQSIVSRDGKKLCYVVNDKGSELREVQTGAFNDNFVEIKSGLAEGDKVLLNPPRLVKSEPGAV